MTIFVGTERTVNSTTTGSQYTPEVTQLGSGKLQRMMGAMAGKMGGGGPFAGGR